MEHIINSFLKFVSGALSFTGTSVKFTNLAGSGQRVLGVNNDGTLADTAIPVTSLARAFTYSNILYVNSAGNNTTAQVGRYDLPYATLAAAHTAASLGDKIILLGSINESVTISKFVYLVFAYGASYTGTLTGSGNQLNLSSDGTGRVLNTAVINNQNGLVASGFLEFKGSIVHSNSVNTTISNCKDVALTNMSLFNSLIRFVNIETLDYQSSTNPGANTIWLQDVKMFTPTAGLGNSLYRIRMIAERTNFTIGNITLLSFTQGENYFSDCKFKITGSQPLINDTVNTSKQTFLRCEFQTTSGSPPASIVSYTQTIRIEVYYFRYNIATFNSGGTLVTQYSTQDSNVSLNY
jgi:hypothetical protein